MHDDAFVKSVNVQFYGILWCFMSFYVALLMMSVGYTLETDRGINVIFIHTA
jgi:hypothetical protein